ncbi:hypothetical protein HYFRA_00006825 [Hymenoscyphus fraxineus]|uniref:Uncharacterized protein n=1 Tax=Hymenoscyphus fraxineus TaxID=746836 RepID=A0A9N9PQD1_9HELO|nr:hypothetical protein HYFRA_00006825 [Hymenoscyphus fraxineus]
MVDCGGLWWTMVNSRSMIIRRSKRFFRGDDAGVRSVQRAQTPKVIGGPDGHMTCYTLGLSSGVAKVAKQSPDFLDRHETKIPRYRNQIMVVWL